MGTLQFRTPLIEELPTGQTKQAPGFAWVAVAKNADPAKAALEVTSKKRARISGVGATEAQKEALTARQQREIERRIRDLNADNAKDVNIPIPKREGGAGGGGGGARAGKTPATKKILASGKEFKHYLDDEEAELARTGKVDGVERDEVPVASRASKTPLARRITQEQNEAATPSPPPQLAFLSAALAAEPDDPDLDDEIDGVPPFPSSEEMAALLDAPPLTYSAARASTSTAGTLQRTFCEICGYWGRSKCLKCGARTCSVDCEAIHVADRCLKFYA